MIDKRDINGLLAATLWLILIIWGALDGLTLYVIVGLGTTAILYIETVKQWSFYGLSWEFIVLFIGTVIMLCTSAVYLLAIGDVIERVEIGPIYLSKLVPGYAGLFVYVALQARLLRRQQRDTKACLRKIENGYDKS